MKKVIVLVLVFISISVFAEDVKQLQRMTLSELSKSEGIRAEKLQELLVPDADIGQIGFPLEKIDSRVTNGFIRNTVDNYLESRTLMDVAEDTNYPIKKLQSELGLEVGKSSYNKPLSEFGISVQRVTDAIRAYEAQENGFIWNIVAIGMIIVFIALVVTGIVVARLEYFHRLRTKAFRRKSGKTAKPVVEYIDDRTKRRLAITARKSASEDMLDAYTVVAIATAIRLHEAALEEENRILATWSKASTSIWKTNRAMPNRHFFENRWGK